MLQRLLRGIGTVFHGPEFPHAEATPTETNPFLTEEYWTTRRRFDRDRQDQHQRSEKNQSDHGADQIHRALEHELLSLERGRIEPDERFTVPPHDRRLDAGQEHLWWQRHHLASTGERRIHD